MYISKVHIQGFKSFLGKTDLNFGNGITCIVGPNGCGKTNIVDSIRWILGEQKSSVLRSSKMEDVIFNGTRKRKPLSFCEASIMMHNEGRLPIEYTDIEITRRLFRSGESEYLMNKVPCRLKDINNLFLDTGMGASAYSVIELKMIETILSPNNNERRRLLEEASGINQYKIQRHQTFKKLELTKNDLERIRDILNEVENNVKGLKLQLKRFERHAKLTENLKEKEIQFAAIQYRNLEEKILPMKEEIGSKKSTYSKLSSQMTMDEDLEKKIQSRYDETKIRLNEIDLNINDVSRRLSERNHNIIAWTENVKSNEGQLQRNQDEKEQITEQKKILGIQLEKVTDEIEKRIPEIDNKRENFGIESVKFEELKKSSDAKISEYRDKRKELDDHMNIIFQEETTFKLAENSLETQNQLFERLSTRSDDLKLREIETLEKVSDDRTSLADMEEQSNKFSLSLETIKKEHEDADHRIISFRHENSKLQNECTQLKSRIQLYENIMESRGEQASGLIFMKENGSRYKGYLGILSDLVDIPEKYHQAIDAVLGELSHAVIVKSSSNAQKILEDLKKHKGGKLNIIALDKVPKKINSVQNALSSKIKSQANLKSLVIALLGHVKISEKIDLNNPEASVIVTKKGDMLSQGFVLTGSSVDKKQSSFGKRKDQEKMQIELEKKINLLKNIERDLKEGQMAFDELTHQLTEITRTLDEILQKKQSLEQVLASGEADLNHIQELKLEIRKDTDRANIERTTLENRIQISREKVRKLKDEKAVLRDKMEDFSKKSERLNIDINIQQESVLQKQLDLMEIEKEQNSDFVRKQSLEERLNEFEIRLQRIKGLNKNLLENNNDLEKKLNLEKDLKESHLEDQSKLNRKKIEIEKNYNDAYNELKELQQNIRSHQKIKEERIFNLQDIELKLSNLKNEQQHIYSVLNEKYGADLKSDDSIEINIQESENISMEIDSIVRSIERIGPVNMAVKDEHDKESERFQFLSNQVEDLVKSEKTLKTTINKIDNEARDKFNSTFQLIKENFKNTFTRFFDGGEADIRLEEGVDALESDIEIVARPPGKRTQSLKVLSGGEKALTAISLLFAIYLVKPSPFCILDEVDAPLDDRNILKFTKTLKEFAENTQFIVVTHNKLTMEAADYLYGVTQEEEGISKIVSVRFKGNDEFQFQA